MSEWIKHVKRFQAEKGCSYKDALKHASATYRKGSGLRNMSDTGMSGFVANKRLTRSKPPQKLSGMGSVGTMLKKSSAENVVKLLNSGTDRAVRAMDGSGMHGGNLKKASKKQLIRLIDAIGDKLVGKMEGMGSVGSMLKQNSAENVVKLLNSGTDRAVRAMDGSGQHRGLPGYELMGRGINRINKANRWQTFVDTTLRDTIDTAGKAGRVYNDTTSPLSQLGFGLKRHRKLKGRALLAAGYS